jgi:hypothetical protein
MPRLETGDSIFLSIKDAPGVKCVKVGDCQTGEGLPLPSGGPHRLVVEVEGVGSESLHAGESWGDFRIVILGTPVD